MNFDTVIREHTKRLKILGYDEYSLDSPEKQGRFFEAISRNYNYALQAILVHPVHQEFSVSIAGFFNDRKDIVDLAFHYECEPNCGILRLGSVSARLDNVRKRVYLRDDRDLISSPKLYSVVALARDLSLQPMLLKGKSRQRTK